MEYFVITFESVAQLFLLMLVGAVIYKTGVVRESAKKDLSDLLVNLILPAVILYSFQTQMELSMLSVLLEAFFYCILAHVVFILLSLFLIPKKSHPSYAIARLCAVYTNAGFIGIPLLSALFGAEGTFYAAIYVAVFHLMFWTQGAFSLSAEKNLKSVFRQLCSPTVISVGISLLLFFLGIKIPALLLKPIGYLADMNSPLAMLVTGISLASFPIAAFFKNRYLYYAALLRLLVLPSILAALFFALRFTGMAAVCALVSAACPTGALAPMMALRYGHDEKLASGVFAVTTLLSLFTIPLFIICIS